MKAASSFSPSNFRIVILVLMVHGPMCLHSFAEFIRVGIFSDVKSSQYVFIAANSDYLFTGDRNKKLLVKKTESISFQLSQGVIIGKYKEKVIGKFAHIKCACTDKDGFFRLKSLQPATAAVPFPDFLEMTVKEGDLNAVNVVDLEKYVSSVVEAEAGENTSPEFLKVQAVLSRTFALGHLKRHHKEGYQVCDNVHCQVFSSKSRFNSAILEAVEQTRNMVMADTKNHLVAGAFHSNCGGQTADAKDAWSMPVASLKSVRDTFCLNSNHAVWQKKIDTKTWVNYLEKKNIPVNESQLTDSSFAFVQTSRQYNYRFDTATVSLKKIRYDFNLRSTWFNIIPQGDSLLFQGFGYGHGVGLCQEGAMQMAASGYKMKDIITFYFKGVSVKNYATVKFAKAK